MLMEITIRTIRIIRKIISTVLNYDAGINLSKSLRSSSPLQLHARKASLVDCKSLMMTASEKSKNYYEKGHSTSHQKPSIKSTTIDKNLVSLRSGLRMSFELSWG